MLDQLAGQSPQPGNPDARIAASLLERSGSALATVQRYATAAERSYFRARRELQQARSREFRNKANEAQAWLQGELREFRESVPPERLNLQAALNDDFQPDWPSVEPVGAAPDPTIAVPVYFPPDSGPNRGTK